MDERPERDLNGNLIDWTYWEHLAIEGARTDSAKTWRVDCRCVIPEPCWYRMPSPNGPEWDRWMCHLRHPDPDCPARKMLVANDN